MHQKHQINQTPVQNTKKFGAARGSIPTPELFFSSPDDFVLGEHFLMLFSPEGRNFFQSDFQKKVRVEEKVKRKHGEPEPPARRRRKKLGCF